ncbi:MAG: hypothetical protein H0X64_08740 [Gemmatimonadaceae bacterium]|nr:hypothetical protein [Gemmatimonadaceae bacterium]
MSDDKAGNRDVKRVNPSDDREIDDAALESVAGGCQSGCSNANTCREMLSKGDTFSIDDLLKVPTIES